MKTAIHWFRRDLRINDNTALAFAVSQAEKVWPLFILDDNILKADDMGAARVSFLLQSLHSLQLDLKKLGYPFTIRQGNPESELLQFCHETKAEAVFCNRDYEPYCHKRDQRIFNLLNSEAIGFEISKDSVIWEEQEIVTQAGKPYTVFTPYSKAWKTRVVPKSAGPLAPIKSRSHPFKTIPLPENAAKLGFPLDQKILPGGETAALQRLDEFMSRQLFQYEVQRNLPAADGTSLLSPYLHFGVINVRTILKRYFEALATASVEQQKQATPFLNELIWREFYLQILSNFPEVAQGCFQKKYNAIEWSQNREHFDAWCKGMTGYPIVDAAMRCLNTTGWMHNRNRMIVAMFLAKDLLLPWFWGEKYFMQKLVDGDLAANNGGWQWCASVGTDAAPYFRIFNPVTQGEKFDPDGAFIKRWVPELASFHGKNIHRPWESDEYGKSTCGYPPRIVIHEAQRIRCLALYKKVL